MSIIGEIKRELFSELVGYRPVYFTRNGQTYVYDKPVYKVMSNKEIAKLILQGIIGAVCFYVLIVGMLVMIPPELAF